MGDNSILYFDRVSSRYTAFIDRIWGIFPDDESNYGVCLSMKGSGQDTVDLPWIIIIGLIVGIVLLTFLLLAPSVKGGWLTGVLDFARLLLGTLSI